MGRPLRAAAGGVVYHMLNRANARRRIFAGDGDYAAFERVLGEAVARTGTRLLAYCVLPNHWHLVVWPRRDKELSEFGRWVGVTHTQRWHAHRRTAGQGHVYQGRFKSFPVQDDAHYLAVVRYVERNALRAGLVDRAEDWAWGSLRRRARTTASDADAPPLSDGPLPLPADWVALVNAPMTAAEERAVRESVRRGRPFGGEAWAREVGDRLGLASTFRPRGRPRKPPADGVWVPDTFSHLFTPFHLLTPFHLRDAILAASPEDVALTVDRLLADWKLFCEREDVFWTSEATIEEMCKGLGNPRFRPMQGYYNSVVALGPKALPALARRMANGATDDLDGILHMPFAGILAAQLTTLAKPVEIVPPPSRGLPKTRTIIWFAEYDDVLASGANAGNDLWLRWWREKRPHARAEFADHVKRYKAPRGLPPDPQHPDYWARMRAMGIVILPELVEEIAGLNDDLIPMVSDLTGGTVAKDATREHVAAWWAADRDKWEVPMPCDDAHPPPQVPAPATRPFRPTQPPGQ